MYFSKNEIIELSGGSKHIIVETTKYEENYYYYIAEVNNEETEVESNFRVITTVYENGNLFVKSVKGELAETLTNIFKELLNIENA